MSIHSHGVSFVTASTLAQFSELRFTFQTLYRILVRRQSLLEKFLKEDVAFLQQAIRLHLQFVRNLLSLCDSMHCLRHIRIDCSSSARHGLRY